VYEPGAKLLELTNTLTVLGVELLQEPVEDPGVVPMTDNQLPVLVAEAVNGSEAPVLETLNELGTGLLPARQLKLSAEGEINKRSTG
jgi:hypothetical protein